MTAAALAFSQLATSGQSADPRAELERLRKIKRLKELSEKEAGTGAAPAQMQAAPVASPNSPNPITQAMQASTQKVNQGFYDRKTAEQTAQQERKKAAGAFGGGMDFLVSEDNAPKFSPIDKDISKGLITSPLNALNAASDAAQGMLNLPVDALNSIPGGRQIPKLDIPKIDLPTEMQSVTGGLQQGLMQFLLTRGIIGKAAPGGGLAADLGKDALAIGAGFDADTPRVAEMANEFIQKSGSPQIAKDYVGFLAQREPNNPLLERFKNALEDLTMSGPMLAPQGLVRGGQAVSNALTKPTAPIPTNAGGARVSASIPPTAQPRPSSRGAAANNPPLNAAPVPSPATAPAYNVPMAKSDAKIIGRLLRESGIPNSDVKPLLIDTVRAYQGFVAQAHQGGQQVRMMPLTHFAEDYLGKRLSPEIAKNLTVKLRAFGNVANNSGDLAKSHVQRTAEELRGSQEGYLTNIFEKELGDKSLLTTKGEIRGGKQLNADAVYKTELVSGQKALADGAATPKQVEANTKLLERMSQKEFFEKVPYELKVEAQNDKSVGGLWEYMTNHPLEAAHWLQSKLGVLARKGGENAGAYHQMRMALVRPLEDAVAGYRGARMRAGDLAGQDIAVEFGDNLFRAGMTDLQTGQMALDFKKLSPAQKTVAERSIRDKLKNEFRGSREDAIDPTTGERIDSRGAMLTKLQKAGTLDAIERVLGPKGKRIADGIREIMRENPRIPSYGSDSAKNLAETKAIGEAVKSPANKAIGAFGDKSGWAPAMILDAVTMGTTGFPFATTAKVGAKIIEKFGKPNAKQMGSAAKTLYELPKPPRNALSGPPATTNRRGPPPPQRGPRPPVTEADIAALRKKYDALNHGRAPVQSQKLAKQIVNAEKRLQKQNALSPPVRSGTGSGPVEKMGFGSGSKSGRAEKVQAEIDQAFAAKDELDDLSRIAYYAEGRDVDVAAREVSPLIGEARTAKAVEAWKNAGGVSPDQVKAQIEQVNSRIEELNKALEKASRTNSDRTEWVGSQLSHAAVGSAIGAGLDTDGSGPNVAGAVAGAIGGLAFRNRNALTRALKGGKGPVGKSAANVERQGFGGGRKGGEPPNPSGRGGDEGGITAYHGTPHTVEKFDMQKVGTGEGHQTYGYGLYFAENPKVAGKYVNSNKSGATGNTYEVKINVKPDELLDLDAPLSAMPQKVQDALRKVWRDSEASDWSGKLRPDTTGHEILDGLGNSPEASEWLMSVGVKGTRFLDKGSRAAGEGTRNLVIFDDSIVQKVGATPAKPTQPKPAPTPSAGKPKGPPRNALSGGVRRAVTGGAVGGAMGYAQQADAQDGFSGEISSAQKSIDDITADLKTWDSLDVKAKQALLIKLGRVRPTYTNARGQRVPFDDGTMGDQTEPLFKAYVDDKRAALAKAEGAQKALKAAQAYAATAPNSVLETVREGAPWLGVILGIGLGFKSRGWAVKNATKAATERAAKANALLTPGPLPGGKSAAASAEINKQVGDVNKFWQDGGGEVPFLPAQNKSGWKSNRAASPAASIYPPGKKHFRMNDVGLIAQTGGEAAVAEAGVLWTDGKIKEIQDKIDKDSTNVELRNELQFYKNAKMVGEFAARGLAGFAATRAFKGLISPYKHVPVDINVAEAQRANLSARIKK